MKSYIPLFILIILLSSCRKSESDFIWEKSYGKGEALFITTSPDSGFIACGDMEGKPYLLRLNKNRNLIVDFSGENPGLFSSVWFDTSGYTTAGNSEGKMLLMHHSPEGNKLWEKTFDSSFKIDFTNLFYTGNGNLLAVATASPDSSDSGATGLLFVRFDTTGQILTESSILETNFVAASGAFVDNEGNIFLAITRKTASDKQKSSVAKFNNLFQKLWETKLYNNPGFGAASIAINLDGSGNVYVAGKTELSTEDGVLNNSFLASLTDAGLVRWKKYLENSNSGFAIIFDEMENLMMLNRNCFIINLANPGDGTEAGRIRMFSLCDSYNTDAFGSGIVINYDENILVAGTRGGNFYLALKSSR
ncbi:MAG TPA: hypothetical protein VMV77_15540 [Bacteroidales bacterium]|nr:hypothetical protein [Bacteroidales bacterium]